MTPEREAEIREIARKWPLSLTTRAALRDLLAEFDALRGKVELHHVCIHGAKIVCEVRQRNSDHAGDERSSQISAAALKAVNEIYDHAREIGLFEEPKP